MARACQGATAGARRAVHPHPLPDGPPDLRSLESVTPRGIGVHRGHAVFYIEGKGKKSRLVACPDPLAHRLKSFAFDKQVGLDERLFRINRKWAWQFLRRRRRTGRDRETGPPALAQTLGHHRTAPADRNPQALQIHLGHASPLTTMRYLSTLTAEDALRIPQEVQF